MDKSIVSPFFMTHGVHTYTELLIYLLWC